MSAEAHGIGCGRRGAGAGGGGREPFSLPGTLPRYAPDRSVDVEHVRLEIAVDPRQARISGTATHRLRGLLGGTTTIRLHAGEMRIDAVTAAQGQPLSFSHEGEDLRITLASPLASDARMEIQIRYEAEPRRGLYFVAPDAAYPDKRHEAWTQGQDEDSRYWFPCFDHPSEKATTEVLIRVPAGYTALSNGALVDRRTLSDGSLLWHWHLKHPHSAYLVMLAVGHYEQIDLGDAPVPLTAYVPPGTRALGERSFGRTAEMVALFGEKFGTPYPYEKYAQVVVQDFIFGGMENTSSTTLLDLMLYDDRAALDFDLDDLVAHELAHQWWGDLLTCRDWHHAWLNEGFATWSELVWREHARGADDAAYDRLEMSTRYMREDGQEYRRAIVDRRYEEPIDLFDRHLYEKGGQVLHMLRRELGEEGFWKTLATYVAAHRYGTVVTEDLRRAVETATGRDLDWFFEQWIYGAGHPELSVGVRHDEKAGVVHLSVKQTQKAENTAESFRLSTRVRIEHAGGEVTQHDVRITRREQGFTFPAASAPRSVVLDPDGDLLASWKEEQSPQALQRILASDAPLRARIRAAGALGREGSGAALLALAQTLRDEKAFWALKAEVAKALGSTRHSRARDALLSALSDEAHPKARRAIAQALGSFLRDEQVGAALISRLKAGDPSYFVEAALAKALGETRVPQARAALLEALRSKDSWAESVRVGVVEGLAALADESVFDVLREQSSYGRHPRLRSAAIQALATVGKRMVVKDPALETLGDLLHETDVRIVVGACQALRRLGDERAIALLQGAPPAHPDGRVHRQAAVAVERLRKGRERSSEVAGLADELARLQKAMAEQRERLERLERGAAGGGSPTA